MEMGLTGEQVLFQESVRRYLNQALPVEAVRRFAASGRGYDDDLWRGLLKLGMPGILVPERFGGSGLGMLDAALAAEALGGAVAPVPFVGSVVMATRAFMASGTTMQQDTWLPRIAAGEVRIGVGFASSLAGQTGTATVHFAGDRLSGRVDGVTDAADATHILIYLADGRAALVEATAAGVSMEKHLSIDRTRPAMNVAFEGAVAEILDAAKDRRGAALRVLDAGRVALAADTRGAAQTMLDRAVAYAKERMQFGRIIGSFQGVKYMCSDMVTMLEPCRAFVWHAAFVQDAIPEEARLWACQVKAHLSDVGREVSRMATEVHGGMGFTDLLGLHYWLKRIGFNRQMLGTAERCRQEAAQVQGWAAA